MAAASAPIHASLEFLLAVRKIFCQSQWLPSNRNILETMASGERAINIVAMTINNPRKEYWPSGKSKQRPPFSSALHYRPSHWLDQFLRTCLVLFSRHSLNLKVAKFLTG